MGCADGSVQVAGNVMAGKQVKNWARWQAEMWLINRPGSEQAEGIGVFSK